MFLVVFLTLSPSGYVCCLPNTTSRNVEAYQTIKWTLTNPYYKAIR